MSLPDNPVPSLPHAAPFLLLDRMVELGTQSGVFTKLVAASDPCVARDGTLPAAFVLEALAQAGGALMSALGKGPTGYLASVDDFRLHADVRVGDLLRIEVELVRIFAGAMLLRGRALVDGVLRAESRFTLVSPR